MVETVVTVERTTTTTSNGPPGGPNPAGNDGGFWSAIRLNIDYFRTVPGILKIVQFVSNGKSQRGIINFSRSFSNSNKF